MGPGPALALLLTGPALSLDILTIGSPCPLATNVTAVVVICVGIYESLSSTFYLI
jgi:uncharacterized membrane protein YraQ (UPF0718 family)